MSNEFLGQILGNVFGGERQSGQAQSPLGGMLGGLGGMLGGSAASGTAGGGLGGLGGMLGGLGGSAGMRGNRDGSALGGKGAALTALLIPLAMQWVQSNGGIGAVLQRFQKKGYSQQAASWVSTGENEPLPAHAIGDVVGEDELSRLSQQVGMSSEDVAGGMAQILPEVVNHLTPEGSVPADSDETLNRGIASLKQYL